MCANAAAGNGASSHRLSPSLPNCTQCSAETAASPPFLPFQACWRASACSKGCGTGRRTGNRDARCDCCWPLMCVASTHIHRAVAAAWRLAPPPLLLLLSLLLLLLLLLRRRSCRNVRRRRRSRQQRLDGGRVQRRRGAVLRRDECTDRVCARQHRAGVLGHAHRHTTASAYAALQARSFMRTSAAPSRAQHQSARIRSA